MYFDSVSDLITMDGHGIYVWVAYAVCFSLLVGFALQTWKEQTSIKQRIKLELRRARRRSER